MGSRARLALCRAASGAALGAAFGVAFGVAGIVALLPARASGSTALATTVVSATVPMANASASQTSATAACPAGSTLVGGGIDLQPGVPGAAFTNGLKINGTGPGDANPVDGATDPTTWTALGGFGGQSDADDTVTASAVCATAGPAATVVATASMTGTLANPGAGLGPVTATCPTGTTLLGGGTSAVPVADGSLKPIASYPSDEAGNPVAAGATNPQSWSGVSRNSSAGGPSDGFLSTTTVFALCARSVVSTVVTESSTALTTATGSAPQSAITTCPSGDALLGGGVDIDDANTPRGPSQFGVHLIADDATDSSGALVTSGTASSWTATAHTGGIAATVGVHAFAICAAPAATGPTTTLGPGPTTTLGSGPTTTLGSGPTTTVSTTTSTAASTTTTVGGAATTTSTTSVTGSTLATAGTGASAASTTSTSVARALGVTGSDDRRFVAFALGLIAIGLIFLARAFRLRTDDRGRPLRPRH